MDQKKREALAEKVVAAFAKLAAHKTDIKNLWKEFEKLQPQETIRGCKTKTEFCEKHLGRSIRAVQYMLDGGNHSRGETVSPITKEYTPAYPKEYDNTDPNFKPVKGWVKGFPPRTPLEFSDYQEWESDETEGVWERPEKVTGKQCPQCKGVGWIKN